MSSYMRNVIERACQGHERVYSIYSPRYDKYLVQTGDGSYIFSDDINDKNIIGIFRLPRNVDKTGPWIRMLVDNILKATYTDFGNMLEGSIFVRGNSTLDGYDFSDTVPLVIKKRCIWVDIT